MNAEKPENRSSAEAATDQEATSAPPEAGPRPSEGEEAEKGASASMPEQEQDEVSSEVDAQRDRYLRLAAEYDNYRKRTERERTESWVRAQSQLVERLLDPLDDLQRVAHFSAENTTVESLLEGVQLVERKLLRMLEGAGLEMVDPTGERFDPALHEALMTAPAEDREEDDVVGEVFQKGYQFKGVLLRPARVQVKKYEG
jgi:molecular chaperone GrpE